MMCRTASPWIRSAVNIICATSSLRSLILNFHNPYVIDAILET